MGNKIEDRIKNLGFILPEPPSAVANYVPALMEDNILYISGQISMDHNGDIMKGRLGETVSIEQGQAAAKLCAINILSQAKSALGTLDRIERVLKLGGFVNATPDFIDHPRIMNGASDFMVEVFGKEKGSHVRFAVGCTGLPLEALVEVEAVLKVL